MSWKGDKDMTFCTQDRHESNGRSRKVEMSTNHRWENSQLQYLFCSCLWRRQWKEDGYARTVAVPEGVYAKGYGKNVKHWITVNIVTDSKR